MLTAQQIKGERRDREAAVWREALKPTGPTRRPLELRPRTPLSVFAAKAGTTVGASQ